MISVLVLLQFVLGFPLGNASLQRGPAGCCLPPADANSSPSMGMSALLPALPTKLCVRGTNFSSKQPESDIHQLPPTCAGDPSPALHGKVPPAASAAGAAGKLRRRALLKRDLSSAASAAGGDKPASISL